MTLYFALLPVVLGHLVLPRNRQCAPNPLMLTTIPRTILNEITDAVFNVMEDSEAVNDCVYIGMKSNDEFFIRMDVLDQVHMAQFEVNGAEWELVRFEHNVQLLKRPVCFFIGGDRSDVTDIVDGLLPMIQVTPHDVDQCAVMVENDVLIAILSDEHGFAAVLRVNTVNDKTMVTILPWEEHNALDLRILGPSSGISDQMKHQLLDAGTDAVDTKLGNTLGWRRTDTTDRNTVSMMAVGSVMYLHSTLCTSQFSAPNPTFESTFLIQNGHNTEQQPASMTNTCSNTVQADETALWTSLVSLLPRRDMRSCKLEAVGSIESVRLTTVQNEVLVVQVKRQGDNIIALDHILNHQHSGFVTKYRREGQHPLAHSETVRDPS